MLRLPGSGRPRPTLSKIAGTPEDEAVLTTASSRLRPNMAATGIAGLRRCCERSADQKEIIDVGLF